jgi:hypothetical protein
MPESLFASSALIIINARLNAVASRVARHVRQTSRLAHSDPMSMFRVINWSSSGGHEAMLLLWSEMVSCPIAFSNVFEDVCMVVIRQLTARSGSDTCSNVTLKGRFAKKTNLFIYLIYA